METITAVEILAEVKTRWPDCHCEIGDTEYMLPSLEDLKKEVEKTKLENWEWTAAADCEDFGALFRAWLAQKAFLEKLRLAWPVAEVRGHFEGITARHELIAVWLEEGLHLVEPQNDDIRRPGPNDHIGALWM